MTKNEAIAMFGGTRSALADAIGRDRLTIYRWPEQLEQDQVDLVMGAALRLGILPGAEAVNPVPSDDVA